MTKDQVQNLLDEIQALDADIEVSERNLLNARRHAHEVYSSDTAAKKDLNAARDGVLNAQMELEAMVERRAALFRELTEALPGFLKAWDEDLGRGGVEARKLRDEVMAEAARAAARLAVTVEACEGRFFVKDRHGLRPAAPSVEIGHVRFGSDNPAFRAEYEKEAKKLAEITPFLTLKGIEDDRLSISALLEADPKDLAETCLKLGSVDNLRRIKIALARTKAA